MADPSSHALPPAAATRGADPTGIERLTKMSTTAGVGSQDYVAINPIAIAAFLLGLVSVIALLDDLLLLVPALGVVCAIVAWRQVRASNGTQTGAGLAIAGIALALLVGGGVTARKVAADLQTRSSKQQIAALVQKLGEQLAAGRYHEAYLAFDERFHQRISEEKFTGVWTTLQSLPEAGGVDSMRWNEQIEFADEPGGGAQYANAVVLTKFHKPPDPVRQSIVFRSAGGAWSIDNLPQLFPVDPPPSQAPPRRQ